MELRNGFGRRNRKGFYFSTDAMFAATLLIVTAVLFSIYFFKSSPTAQSGYYSQDIIDLLSEMKVSELNATYLQQLMAASNQTNLSNSIIEQIGIYQVTGETENARNLTMTLLQNMIPARYGFSLAIDDVVLYQRDLDSSKSAFDVQSGKRFVSGISAAKPVKGFTSRAFLSGASNRYVFSYIYFGGYVGDGNFVHYLTLPTVYTNINEAYFEGVIPEDFDLYVNDAYSGTFLKTSIDDLIPETQYVDSGYLSNFVPGTNTLRFNFTSGNGYFGGGVFRVSTNTTDISDVSLETSEINKKIELPGIYGVINLYSSFIVPGNLSSMELFLNYSSDLPVFVNLGGRTVYDSNTTGQVEVTIPNNDLAALLYYPNLSLTTVPLRIGHYQTVSSNQTGNVTDVVITTSVAKTMENMDILGTNLTRLGAAKELDYTFIDIVLNSSGNRIGLVSYFAANAQKDSWLDIDETDLNNTIKAYDEKNSPNRALCKGIRESKEILLGQSDSSRKRIIMLMTDGDTDDPCSPAAPGTPEQQAIWEACNATALYKIKFYAIGFGVGADNDTMEQIANCSGTKYYQSNNFSELDQIYRDLATDIANQSLTFVQQKSVTVGVASQLYESSYLAVQYNQTVYDTFQRVPLTIEDPVFNNTISQGTLGIPSETSIVDAKVVSYSADKWTSMVDLNNTFYSWKPLFDLTDFGSDFLQLGDPYAVYVDPAFIADTNTVRVRTAVNATALAGGSEYNRIIYTILARTFSSSTGIGSQASGCNWNILFEDGSNMTLTIPSSAVTNNTCSFYDDVYNTDDATQSAIYNLLLELDLDDDGYIDINVGYQGFLLSTATVTSVPYLWGPATVEVRLWQ